MVKVLKMLDIVTAIQHFDLLQNFLTELCHERCQDKVCEDMGAGHDLLQYSEKEIQVPPDWSNAVRERDEHYQVRG